MAPFFKYAQRVVAWCHILLSTLPCSAAIVVGRRLNSLNLQAEQDSGILVTEVKIKFISCRLSLATFPILSRARVLALSNVFLSNFSMD